MTMLTLDQVATLLNVSRSTVRRLKDAGHLAYIQVSERCIRFEEAAVNNYIAGKRWASELSGTRKATPATPSSSSSADIVFFDGSRPARRKSRPFSLKRA